MRVVECDRCSRRQSDSLFVRQFVFGESRGELSPVARVTIDLCSRCADYHEKALRDPLPQAFSAKEESIR